MNASDLIQLERDATELQPGNPEHIEDVIARCKAAVALLRDLQKRAEGVRLTHLLDIGGYDHGNTRHYAGTETKKTVVKHDALLHELVGLSVEDLAACLTANPFKHGAVRSVLTAAGIDPSPFIVEETTDVAKAKTVPLDGVPGRKGVR